MTKEFTEQKIGYGRPPEEHQFRKGQSGNPRGRPRGRKSIIAILNRALNETVPVQEGGKRKMIRRLRRVPNNLPTESRRETRKR